MTEISWPICENCDGYCTMQKRQLGPNSTRKGYPGAACPVCGGAGRIESPAPRPAVSPNLWKIPPDEGTAPVPAEGEPDAA